MSDPPSLNNDKISKTTASELKKEKIGHRRVNIEGTVTYKKKTTSEIQCAIQLGVNLSVGSINNKPKRDLLLKDFGVEEVISVPKCGTSKTPAHQLTDFQFRTYAPLAFRCFRDIFTVDMCAFMDSICSKELQELSNAGASGSIFYLTQDDEFIIKTVQKKEAKFLQKLLPEYYMNLMQHPRTLLPKFFGLFSYETMGKNIRFVIMNNLLPSIKMHEKYDLKGSSFKRYASSKEKAKSSPTFKDLDFKEKHPNGITLDADTYDALMSTIQRDCMVLESFSIMDYSLLLTVIYVDQYRAETSLNNIDSTNALSDDKNKELDSDKVAENGGDISTSVKFSDAPSKLLSHGRSIKRIAAFTTPLESIKPATPGVTFNSGEEDHDFAELPEGGIPARSEKGEKLYLYLGIIDILQSYQLNKKLEHSFKSIIHDGEKISVTKPSFYKTRFEEMFANTVFKKAASKPEGKFKKAGILGLRPKRRASRIPETEPSTGGPPQRSKSEVHYPMFPIDNREKKSNHTRSHSSSTPIAPVSESEESATISTVTAIYKGRDDNLIEVDEVDEVDGDEEDNSDNKKCSNHEIKSAISTSRSTISDVDIQITPI